MLVKFVATIFFFIIIMITNQTLIYTSHLNKQKHEYLKSISWVIS